MVLELEREHVHKVYSEIAEHFSDTRFKPWPKIAEFLGRQQPGSLIADVGCGNGKYLGVNPKVLMVGSDICPELVSIGRTRGHEVMTCDCLHLPYRSNLFDGLICIAVIHHLSSEERRLRALLEMARVLSPGGSMLVYVWAMEQQRKKFGSQDVMVPWHLQPKYSSGGGAVSTGTLSKEVKASRAKAKRLEKRERKRREKRDVGGSSGESEPGERGVSGSWGDCRELCVAGREGVCSEPKCEVAQDSQDVQEDLKGEFRQDSGILEAVSSKSSAQERSKDERTADLGQLGYTTYQRYYHVFREGELLQLVSKVPALRVEQEYYDHENWCVLAVKNKI